MTTRTPDPDAFAAAWSGPIPFLPPNSDTRFSTVQERDKRQGDLRQKFADELYGHIPPPPDAIEVTREPISGEQAERLRIEMAVGRRRFSVDAALSLPAPAARPAPLICGLDFVGPLGILSSTGYPIDPDARISPRPKYGAPDGRLTETLRGTSAFRWPIGMLREAGFAVLVSCYGSWVPDDATAWKDHGLFRLLDCENRPPVGALSLWAWAIQRIVDVAEKHEEIEGSRISVAGHSRLGKAALWAAANDTRIKAVFANQSGCGGAAPAAHPVGETFDQMADRFPHWTIPESHRATRNFDQHHLLAQIAPRAVYLGGAIGDLWADPVGSFAALEAAAPFWHPGKETGWGWPLPPAIWSTRPQVLNGPLGYHLRPGEHDQLPHDWRQFLNFLDVAVGSRAGAKI